VDPLPPARSEQDPAFAGSTLISWFAWMDRGQAAPVLGAGRFEIKGTLGEGGAGTVYRAYDRQLQREVALKLLRHAAGRDLYRFKREFRALADITHSGLVTLHELHSWNEHWFFTMEIVEGVSFVDWVRPPRHTSGPKRTRQDILQSPVNDARLRGALIQLVDALIALHRAGKLHRDLKPSNVLVTAHGRVALLDFGLVAGVAEGDPERLAVGTPVYMSPEQASDQPLAEPSDWYSVGCMLYEALTGRRPFEGDSQDVMTRKQSELPANPLQHATRAPLDLARLCMALLQPAPHVRPTGLGILTQLGAAPSRTTRALTRSVPPPSFVGRAQETGELQRALADARRRGVAMLVKGKSGIGKSTLVRRFLRNTGEAVFVLEGRCFEREAVPFKMLDGVVDTLTSAVLGLSPEQIAQVVPREAGALARLFPVTRRIPAIADALVGAAVPPDPQELRVRGFGALRELLSGLAAIRPVIVFVDDAHWGDADSCVFLAELIHGAEPGMLIVVAHRPEDYLGVVAQLRRPRGGSARRGDVRELELAPLADADALSLVQQLASDGDRASAIVAAAGGNPLALSEMARAAELPAGTRMDDLVRERMRKLTLDAQAMLAVSSIAARPLPVEIAAHAAGVAAGLEEASRLSSERLATLRQVGPEMILHPAHDYVRSAVLASLDPESKASWHEAIARAFEAVQGAEHLDSLAVVEHWLAAGHPANAAHHAGNAAQRAEAALAFARAAELYEIALAYGPWDAAGQRDLMRRKAFALACAGQLDEAAMVYGHAAQLLVDDAAIDLERLRVEALLRRGRMDEALPAAEKLLAQIGLRIPLSGRTSRLALATQWVQAKLRGLEHVERPVADIPAAELLATDVLYSIASGLAFADPALGRVVQGELLRASLDAGDSVRVCLALAQEVTYAGRGGTRNRAAVDAVGARLEAVARRVGAPHVIGFARTATGIAAHMSGRWRDSRVELEAGLGALRDHGLGVRWEIGIGDSFWLSTLFYLGEWIEMSRVTHDLLRDAIDRGDVVAQQTLRVGTCNLAWLLRGKPDEARAQLEIAERSLGDGFYLPRAQALLASANIDLYTGDAASAGHRIRDAWVQLEKLGFMRLQQRRLELVNLRARIALADHRRPLPERLREAREHASELVGEGAAWAEPLGHLLLAACHAWDGASAVALAALQTAEGQLVTQGMAAHVQIVRMYRGRLEGGAGGIARAEAARDSLMELGASDPDAIAAHLVPWPGDVRSAL
jgi:tRNA A-37 threonylcarbamoyl transferase component Bud32/tetratricopeptide (TPR) repeat protein